MKKLLLLLACMIATIAVSAQDIIVKKDGTTILAKVLRVTVDEVKYKAFSNQSGPTLTIRISELLSINYEDGEKTTFNTSASPSTNNTSIVTHETATQYSDDASLLRIYNALHTNSQLSPEEQYSRKAKKLKLTGYIVGGSLMTAGIILFGFGDSSADGWYFGAIAGSGVALMSTGLIVGLPCILRGNQCSKLAKRSVSSYSLWNSEIKFNNGSHLDLGFDAIGDNLMQNKTVGLGVRYNF